MRRSWPMMILGLALIGALIWGYVQNRQRAQLAVRTQNSYQHSFHRLDAMVVDLEDALARARATGSPRLARQALADARVYSVAAVESLAGLPLINVSLERTSNFFEKVRDAAELYTRQLDRGENLATDQRRNLGQLHQQSTLLKQEISRLVPEVAHGNVWVQTERAAMANVDGSRQTPLLQAVTAIDGKLQPPGEAGTENAPPPLPRPKGNLGPEVSPQEAVQKAAGFLDIEAKAITPDPHPIDGDFPLFVVGAVKANNVPVSIAVSQKGGHVIWMIDGRDVKRVVLNEAEATETAKQFLAKNGMGVFTERFYDEYGEAGAVAMVSLVPVRDGITYFNEVINVRVARDDGEILGYDATQYWVNRHDRPAVTPAMTGVEAAAHLASGLVIENIRLGVMDVFRGQEVLVYKVRARLAEHVYDVFINADTGEEERIERVEEIGIPGRQEAS